MGKAFMDMANLVENSLDGAPVAKKPKPDPTEPKEDKRSARAAFFSCQSSILKLCVWNPKTLGSKLRMMLPCFPHKSPGPGCIARGSFLGPTPTKSLIMFYGLHPGTYQKAKSAADKGTCAWNRLLPVLQQYSDDSETNKYSQETDNKPHVAQKLLNPSPCVGLGVCVCVNANP